VDTLDALVVDREPRIRADLASALARIGFCVTETDDGRHALAIVETKPCLDLLVIETQPGKVDGRTVAESYLASCPSGRVIMTSLADDVGTINCESDGTWVFLQRNRVSDSLLDALRAVGLAHASRVILLVEDEPAVRRFLQMALTQAGHRVLQAANGMEALEISRSYEGAIDLLISDIEMPRVTGPQLARHIKAQRPQIQILLMTGCLPEPFVGYPQDWHILEKPFRPTALLGKINGMLQSLAL